MKTVLIDGAAIKDEASFHHVFKEAFGFPVFYGCNFSAWVDCMSYLDEPEAGMSSVSVPTGEVLAIAVENAKAFKKSCPDVWLAFLECAAFVNWRRVEQGDAALLSVSAYA